MLEVIKVIVKDVFLTLGFQRQIYSISRHGFKVVTWASSPSTQQRRSSLVSASDDPKEPNAAPSVSMRHDTDF
jgi:hypothetical protein